MYEHVILHPGPVLGGPERDLLTFNPVAPIAGHPGADYPEQYRTRISIDVVHDGDWIPQQFLEDRTGHDIAEHKFLADYARERDWGASAVAAHLAGALGVAGFCRVEVARVLMDFGRFPGSTPRHADHLHRFAINFPFSHLLSYKQKKRLLEKYYDNVSHRMEHVLDGKLLKIAIHTYDRHNESGTVRPPVSLLTRSVGYDTHGEMPWGLFDPLYPDILGEFTSDRILRDRISLMLEKANISVGHNYPYNLPEGSLEVRYQVWSFFNFVKRCFEQEFPHSREQDGFRRVWDMVMDTNLRSSKSEALRSYLHMFRHVSEDQREEFEAAERAYEQIAAFVGHTDRRIVEEYRFSPERSSSLAIEVRKDLIFDYDQNGLPTKAYPERVAQITDTIAGAVAMYLREDRHPEQPDDIELERADPWYNPGRNKPIR